MRTIERGGVYFRVASPEWRNPLDGRFAGTRGGRWNAPGSFGVVYMCATVGVSRAIVLERLDGQPFGPEDLDPTIAPVLVEASVPRARYVDVVTSRGCVSAGLPATYPRDGSGRRVGHRRCQPIGQAAWDSGAPGIACRSAAAGAPAGDEELAWFERGPLRLARRGTRSFEEWFWPAPAR